MTYDVALLPGDGIRPRAVHEALRNDEVGRIVEANGAVDLEVAFGI